MNQGGHFLPAECVAVHMPDQASSSNQRIQPRKLLEPWRSNRMNCRSHDAFASSLHRWCSGTSTTPSEYPTVATLIPHSSHVNMWFFSYLLFSYLLSALFSRAVSFQRLADSKRLLLNCWDYHSHPKVPGWNKHQRACLRTWHPFSRTLALGNRNKNHNKRFFGQQRPTGNRELKPTNPVCEFQQSTCTPVKLNSHFASHAWSRALLVPKTNSK